MVQHIPEKSRRLVSPVMWKEKADENEIGEERREPLGTKRPRFRFLLKGSASRPSRPSFSKPALYQFCDFKCHVCFIPFPNTYNLQTFYFIIFVKCHK